MNSYTEENRQIPEMQQNLELLEDVPFFSSFPVKALKLLAFIAERDLFQPGDILCEKGCNSGKAYLIISGKLVLLNKSDTGSSIVQNYRNGDSLGFFSLLESLPSLFVLQAEEGTTVLSISRAQFAKILEQFPETAKLALNAVLKELHHWERQNIIGAKECCLNMTGATVL